MTSLFEILSWLTRIFVIKSEIFNMVYKVFRI